MRPASGSEGLLAESTTESHPTLPFVTDPQIVSELRQIENACLSIQVTAGATARRAAELRQLLEPRLTA